MEQYTYSIELSRVLASPPPEVYAIVKDVESYPEFMPNVESIELVESDGNRKVAAWDTIIDDAPLDWVEEGIYDDKKMQVDFRSLEGVFDRFDGFWKVTPEADGSRVSFELSYEIGLPEIEEIVGPILRERLIENVESMLDAIEKRAEAE